MNKSITIQGHVGVNENGGQLFTNVIDAIFVTGGAEVTLKDICIQKNIPKSNNLSVREGSTLHANNVYLFSSAESGEFYPAVYIDGQSHVKFEQVQLDEPKNSDANYDISVEDSELTLLNSTINVHIFMSHAVLDCQQSTINFHNANALFMKNNSRTSIESSTISGGLQTKKTNYSCVKIVDSKLTSHNSVITQPKFNAALAAVNSQLTLNGGRIDSLNVTKTTVTINETFIQESVGIKNGSTLTSKRFFIFGRANGTINLYASGHSTIKADRINFGQITNPNIKLERGVSCNIEHVNYYQYDSTTQKFIVDDTHHYIRSKIKGKISYFGDLSAYEQLNNMIGIQNVKDEVNEFVAIAEMNKKRRDKGLSNSVMTLHSLFLGNPGTGKTTVARLLGKVLYEKKIITNQKYVEVSRSDLVAKYSGQTASQTRQVLESALGGVLFIDEAYTLASDDPSDFGGEAIDEILKFMEDHRSDIVIIFAGYTDRLVIRIVWRNFFR